MRGPDLLRPCPRAQAAAEVGLVLAQRHDVEVRKRLAQQGLGVQVRRQWRPAGAVVEIGQQRLGRAFVEHGAALQRVDAVGQGQLALAQGRQLGVGLGQLVAGLVADVQLGFLELALGFLDGGLDAVDLQVSPGEYLAVMGPSGSGKSTLLNILGLLDAPDSGEYWLSGEATAALDEIRRAELRSRHIGFVFQSYHLIPRLTALENIELPMLLAGIEPAERQRRSARLVERLNLGDRVRHRPAELSGGQRQRVAIARAMVMQPALLLADEPTGNLDSHSGAEVIRLLEELNGEGLTLLIVTHDAALGARARRCLRMRDGRIIEDVQQEQGDARG